MLSYGLPFFGKHRSVFMIIAVLFTNFALLFIICAMAAWSTDSTGSVLTSVPWTKSSDDNTADNTYYYGLQMVYFTRIISNNTTDISGGTAFNSIRYSDSSCTEAFCDSCGKAGKAALGLLLTSFFLALIIAVILIIRATYDKTHFQFVVFVLDALVFLFTLSSFADWSNKCKSDIINMTPSNYKIENGAGFNLAVAAFFFMIFAGILNILTPLGDSPSGPGEQNPSRDPNSMAAHEEAATPKVGDSAKV